MVIQNNSRSYARVSSLDLLLIRKRNTHGKSFKQRNRTDLYVIDLDFMVRIVNAKWPRTFKILIVRVIDALCAVEFVLSIVSIMMMSATVSAENLGASVIDIACMSQITSHVHASLEKRSAVLSSLESLLKVAKAMQASCNPPARKRMRRCAYVIRGITIGTFITIAICLIVNLLLNRPEYQTTPVATWPTPGPDMPVTIAIISVLQVYATLSGSVIFCIVSSIHFGSILYAVTLFYGLDSCIRCLHLHSDSANARYIQFVKYAQCHQSVLGAMFEINQTCKTLLFTRVSATFAVLVYTGVSISLGYISMRVIWMTAFGFITLFQLTLTGQYLTESAEGVADAFYESEWYKEGTEYQKILHIALQRTIKPLHMSTWFCRQCDLPFFIEFVRQWYSAVQMMYKARTRTTRER